MLPEITPETFIKVVGVDHLPPKDFTVVSATGKDDSGEFNVHRYNTSIIANVANQLFYF